MKLAQEMATTRDTPATVDRTRLSSMSEATFNVWITQSLLKVPNARKALIDMGLEPGDVATFKTKFLTDMGVSEYEASKAMRIMDQFCQQ
jgi:hypothetical protein